MITYDRITSGPSEYVWHHGRRTGHVWRSHDGAWCANVEGQKGYGRGRTRLKAITNAIFGRMPRRRGGQRT